MKPVEAINTISELQEKTKKLIEYLRLNKPKATSFLISELEEIVTSVITEKKLQDKNIDLILGLIGEFRIKEVFQNLDIILSKNMVSRFHFNVFGQAVCSSVTEAELPRLKEYISCTRYYEDTRQVAYLAIRELLLEKNSKSTYLPTEDFDIFLSEVIAIYPTLDRIENHTFLNYIFLDYLNSTSYKIHLEMKDLLIRLIIEDENGDKSSCFKDYFKWLYQVEPTLSHTVLEIIKFINQYNKQMDIKVFDISDLQGVGKHIFLKAIESIELATADIVKLAVKQMHRYPSNNRPEPTTDEGYYTEMCINAGIIQLPKTILEHAQKQYESVLENGIKNATSIITKRIANLEKLKLNLKKQTNKVVEDSNYESKQILYDINLQVVKLDEKQMSLKKYNAEIGLLKFYEEKIKGLQISFLKNNAESDNIDSALKKLAFRVVGYSDDDKNGLNLNDYFNEYKKIIEKIVSLVGSSTVGSSIDLIFDKIVFLPFIKKIRENSFFGYSDAERLKNKIIEHPLNPENLMEKRKDMNVYISLLQQYSKEAISNIRDVFSESILLEHRKEIIKKCIQLFLDGEYELFVNILPIQIEGMFNDLLRSMVFDLFEDINIYPNAVLRNKIKILNEKNTNMFFEVEAYFKYYFNDVIRNTIAHGNFALLSDSDFRYEKLALELLFTLNYLADAIFSINELDAMNEYVHKTACDLKSCEEREDCSIFYGCLFSDLNGTRSRFWKSNYNSGFFKTYPPKQILWWIFNPSYESFCKYPDELTMLRNTLKSSEFWDNVLNKLNFEYRYSRFDKAAFQNTVKIMISLTNGNSEINETLKKIDSALSASK